MLSRGRASRSTHDLEALEVKLKLGGLRGLTRGERIAAAKAGFMPPVRSERERQLRSRYGLTLEDYDAMLVSQDGMCGACGQEWHKLYYVDHDHDTGLVRGLLCASCNTMVGLLESRPERLTECSIYLLQHELGTDNRFTNTKEVSA